MSEYRIQGETGEWEVVIGLEVHAQVTSNAKLFSGAATAFGAEPNTQVSLVDAAMPGMLPVPNRECIRQAVRTGMALGYELVPIFGNDRIEANDPDHYASELLDAVLTHWTLPDTKVTTLQDWTKGRRAEVDEINGLVVAEQARLGGDAPINTQLVEIAHRIERGELDADPANAEMLRALLS